MSNVDHEPTGEITLGRRGVAALELLHSLDDDATQVTAEQRQVLAGWGGWGPLAKALGNSGGDRAWYELTSRVEKILDWQHRQDARNACDTAFYTPQAVTAAVWQVLTGLGFDGGRVLEPGCGSLRFADAAPPGMQVEWTGVEADQASAEIARLLHPGATVHHQRLEKQPLRYGSFDAAIGNVPFSSQGVYDANAPKGISSLHGYFLWRALQAVRPGGLAVFVTSRWTLDSAGTAERDELAALGVFLGAVRLPDTALAPGGTRAVTDIIVFRRRTGGGEQDVDPSWREPATQPGLLMTTVSQYFQGRPHMVAGTMTDRGGRKYGMTLAVTPDEVRDIPSRVYLLLADAARAGLAYTRRAGPDLALPDGLDPALEGHYTLDSDGTVSVQRDGRTVRVQAHPELVALITLGGLAERLFAAEADEQMGNNERNRLRQAAMRAYQEYTAEFGYLSRGDLVERPDPGGEPGETMLVREYDPVRRMFRQDPVWPTLLAVEVWDDDEQAGVPALILSRRVGARPARKEHTDDPAEALLLCLDRCGQVDLDVIAAILQVPAEDVPVLLGPAIWRDPADMCWVTADEYLSGNVRAKLAQALAAGEGWEGNAAALETVQPEDLGPEEINVQLGAPWMPPEIVERFVCHLLHIELGVRLGRARHLPV